MKTIETEELIRALAKDAQPVKRLPQPVWRALLWTLLATASVTMFVFWFGLRADLTAKLAEPRFIAEVAAAFLTSVMAAAAAFCSGCPGRPLWERLAPLPFLAVWLFSLGEGCWREITQSAGPSGFGMDWACSEKILLLSLLPAAIMFAMVRRGAPIAPLATAGLGALAATSLAAAGLRLFHTQDTSMMLIVWQFGTVIVMTAAAMTVGHFILPWRHTKVAIR
ncbi:MAG: DUF1109 domain-containing protein [Alphaproteobacteria bacterium]|nr:DUF1109 domain-containing protein [Alphaproteobacteria bacterium]